MINVSESKASKVTTAHDYAWEVENGPVPDGFSVLHKCDHAPCCRGDHLFLGTHRDNMDDMVSKGRNVFGTKSAFAKLTEEDVQNILDDHRSNRQIAKDYDVSRQLIDGIKAGRRWTHVA
jgi:hypothetical protein